MKRHIFSAAALLFAAAAGPAFGYTAFIMPDTFNPDDGDVSVSAGYANTFFTSAVGVPADMQLLHPDGYRGSFARAAADATVTTLQSDLPQWGTYRISTGEMRGGISTLVGENGSWRPLAEGETPPADALTSTIQTVNLADAYISRGPPTREVLDHDHGALAIVPVTHPNEVLVSQGLVVELRFNNQPFPNMPIVLYDAGDADTDQSTFFVTDAQGRATITLPAPGHYVIAARHRADAPADAGVNVRSYVTTLTFHAITAIPNYPQPPQAERPRRRRAR